MSKGYTHLSEILMRPATECPHHIAYRFLTDEGEKIVSYYELHTKAQALAASLQSYPSRGERAMLLLPPGLDYIIAFFGCLYAGVIPVPAYPPRRNHHANRLSAIIRDAQAKFILTHQIFTDKCRSLAPYLIFLDTLDNTLTSKHPLIKTKSTDIAFIQYTSGSTSHPKGVMISHHNILTNLEIIQRFFKKNTKKACCWLPPYHDMGLIGGIFFPLSIQVPAILMSPTYFLQKPFRWLEILSKEQVSISVAPNFAYDLCVNKITHEQIKTLDLSHWHYAVNGSEPIYAETITRFNKTFAPAGFKAKAMRPVYGLAEATLIVTGSRQVKKLTVSQTTTWISSGSTPKNIDIQIVDPVAFSIVPKGKIGEIWVKGPNIAMGYWNQSSLSKTIFQAQLLDKPGNDYLRTGDLGFTQEGDLYVTGRIKDVIIIRGMNHYPHDIEKTVSESHPALQAYATAAFSITQNNEEQLIVMQEIAREHLLKLNSDSVIKTIRSAILSTHGLQAHSIVLLKPFTLPKTSSGKVQRFACKECFLNQSLSHIACWTIEYSHEEIFAWLAAWFRQRFHVEIKLSDTLAELNLDSVIAIELNSDLQQWLKKSYDHSCLLEQRSIQDVIHFLVNHENKPITEKPYINYPHVETLKKAIYFQTTSGISRDTTLINGEKYINFSGYNYLGMSGDPYVTDAVIQAVKEYGTSVSASRIASGQKPIHEQLEKAIANLIGTEECLVYSAGHATNISVITHLFGANDLILFDELSHNSIVQGALFSRANCFSFPHNNYIALKNLLEKYRSQHKKALIVSEGIFSMDGDIPDVHQLVKLKQAFDTMLMIDEAHSIGTIGKTGGGIREYFDIKPQDIDIWMGTLSKSFASCGGYIAGASHLIENLKYQAAGFVYSAGISPANTAAALASIQLMKQQPDRITTLRERHTLLLNLLKKAKLPTGDSYDSPIIPIITRNDQAAIDLSLTLKKRGIYTIPIIYPAVPKDSARIRLFINSLHTEEAINYTARMIQETYSIGLAMLDETLTCS